MDEQQTPVPAETGQQVAEIMYNEDISPTHGQRPASSPGHLVLFPDTSWGLWRWFALRGAGFPASQVLQLALPTCAQAVDFLLICEDEVEHARLPLWTTLSEEVNNAQGETRNLLLKAARRVKEGKQFALSPSLLSMQTQALLEAFQVASSRRDLARADLSASYASATMQTLQTLATIARDDSFREAITWQNRRAVHEGLAPFLRSSLTNRPTRSQRVHARLIARYLQRYCVKNDSIGFFGPVGWGRWVSQDVALTVRPGPEILATRTVYFETWAIDVLGETLAQDAAFLPWAIPRPMPFLSLSGTTLSMPFVRPLQLSVDQATVLAACDGQRTARYIAQALLHTPCPGLASEADVFAILAELREARRITWTFDVSMEDWHPERTLKQQLEQITPPSLRQDALKPLEQLEAARSAVAVAAGNVDQLDRALEYLESTFTRLTARAATREAGKTYAARTLIYEDCRRNLELTLGPTLLTELASPLSLLLTSARWFTYNAARFYRKALHKKYSELVQKTGATTVDFAMYWSWVQSLLPAVPGQLLLKTLLPEFQKRWAAVLNVPPGQRRVHYTSQDLQCRVQDIFQAPHAGWRSACYHSPDVLIAATSDEAILHGDYELVLGEFHQGTNTLDFIAFATQHPAPSELLQAVAADQPEGRVVPVFSRHTIPVKRGHAALMQANDWRLIFGTDSAGVPLERALPLGLLVLEEREGELVVRTRDGSQQFDLLEVFDGMLAPQVCDTFKILASAPYMPRITIDRLVICRETWRFAPEDLSWALHNDSLEGYVGIRRWARRHKIPRFFFVRTPCERKPFYVDLDSAIYVDLFAKAVRQAIGAIGAKGELITLTEMFPDPEHAWLPDANGNRYTCEMRMVAVDQLQPPIRNMRTIRS